MSSRWCHPSAPTLGSRKIDCKQAHYVIFSMKLLESWIPVSSTDHLQIAIPVQLFA
nr:hypothetical protein [Wolbachia endosymbiont of Cylisticus convexus]